MAKLLEHDYKHFKQPIRISVETAPILGLEPGTELPGMYNWILTDFGKPVISVGCTELEQSEEMDKIVAQKFFEAMDKYIESHKYYSLEQELSDKANPCKVMEEF